MNIFVTTHPFGYPQEPTFGHTPTEHISSLEKWLHLLVAGELTRVSLCCVFYLVIVGLNIGEHA